MTTATKGLAGVIAADTRISRVDGEKGELIYRGYNILDIGEATSFEEVIYLLWHGDLPNEAQLAAFQSQLVARRTVDESVLRTMKTVPATATPMAVLRTFVSWLGLIDADADDNSLPSVQEKAITLTAALPTLVAAWERIRNGQEPIAPRADLGHAANFLYMLNGTEPDAAAVNALNAYLVLLADHGFNASTFAARVTTGTLADTYSAITTGIGTLKGGAHGGANQLAMEQFMAAANSGDVAAWYHDARANDRRIMGIGHRVYKVEDPRARILRPLAAKMAQGSGQGHWYDVAAQIESLTRQDEYFVTRNLYANVDYYSAVVLYMIGLPTDQFTCLFAMSRIAGWTAHVMEQVADNRLIRPKAQYVGATGRAFVPLVERS
ncbi:MAG: citrate synthase [Ardenticatenales bacterium]|nr:citrate synthase [Ardenticatenales bacterium]